MLIAIRVTEAKKVLQCKIFIPGTKQKVTSAQKKRLKLRNEIEPVIGHLKDDLGMARNYLKGRIGDKINALIASCGFNLKKLLKPLRAFFVSNINESDFRMFKAKQQKPNRTIGVFRGLGNYSVMTK